MSSVDIAIFYGHEEKDCHKKQATDRGVVADTSLRAPLRDLVALLLSRALI